MGMGLLLKSRRRQLKLTQQELSEGICSITYISKIENNLITPHEGILDHLLARLNLDPEDLEVFDKTKMLDNIRNVFELLEDANTYAQGRDLIPQILEGYNQSNHPLVKAGCGIVLAYFNTKDKKYDDVPHYLELTDEHFKLLPDDFQFKYLKVKGLYYHRIGALKDSLNVYLDAEKHMKLLKKVDVELLYQLGLLNSKLNHFAESNNYLMEALRYYNAPLNLRRIIECNMITGINYSKQGKFNDSKEIFLNLIHNNGESINEVYLSRIYHNLGIAFLYLGEMDQAVEYFDASSELKEEDEETITTLYFLAHIYKGKGNHQKMMDYLDKGLELSQNDLVMYYKFKISKLYALGNEKELINLLEGTALRYFELHHPVVYQECLLLLADLYKNINQYKKCSYYLEKYINLNPNRNREELLL